MWDENSVYPKKENGFALKPQMKDFKVEAFTNQTINQDGNENAFSKKNVTLHPILYFKIFL